MTILLPSYKVMIEAPEPLQNTLDLIDLIPEAFYQLEIRETSDSGNVQILARVTFSTSGKPQQHLLT